MKFRSAIAFLLEKLILLPAMLLVKISPRNSRRELLRYWCLHCGKDRFAPKDPVAKNCLAFWFDLQNSVNMVISQICQDYYDQKHPKHYMWLGHNQYIYDHIEPGQRVLDIGCGGSYYQQWIADKAREVVAVDILPERVEMSKRNSQKPNLKFRLMDVTRELPEGEFDVVVCSHVLEHLDEPVHFLQCLAARIPKIIVKVPLDDSHWTKLVKRDIGMFWMDTDDHRREYNEQLLREQLVAGGWQVQEMIRGFDLRALATSLKQLH